MKYSKKVRDAVAEEMDIALLCQYRATPMCDALAGRCEKCPWNEFDTDGCLDVFAPKAMSTKERAVAACFMAVFANQR